LLINVLTRDFCFMVSIGFN